MEGKDADPPAADAPEAGAPPSGTAAEAEVEDAPAPPPALMDEEEQESESVPQQAAEATTATDGGATDEPVAAAPAPAAVADDDDDDDEDFGDFEEADRAAAAAAAPAAAPPSPPAAKEESPALDAPSGADVSPEVPSDTAAPEARADVAPDAVEAASSGEDVPAEEVPLEESPAKEPPAPAAEAAAAAEAEAGEKQRGLPAEEKEEPPAEQVPPANPPPPPPPPPAAERSVPAQAKSGASTPQPVANSIRATSHSRLRAYEAKRRSAYTSKLSSSSLYWRSFRDLLHSSLEETERAEVLVLGSAMANRAYSEAMACAAEGTLDDDGRPVTDPKKKKKLKERREKVRADRRGGHGRNKADGGGAATLQAETEDAGGLRRSGSLRRGLPQESSLEKRGTLLHALIDSHGTLAERFAENAKFAQEEMAAEIKTVRTELNAEVETMEKLGDAILDELEEAEHEVDRAWEKYYTTATKALGVSTRSEGRKGASSATEPGALEKEPLADCLDVWVVEMQYRMSVAYLSACWEKCSSELSKLFSSMKETECTRRFRLRELMIAFVQRQERLWLSLPSVLTPVLKDLVDRPMDRTSIENDVQQSIRLRAQGIQREEQADKQHREKEARDRTGPGLTGVNASEGNFELSSPLLSDLLFKAHVIEKKASGYMSAWKTTLAVVTADSFLHLFELPAAVRVQSGSAPEVAFHALVPPVEVPTQESIQHRSTKKAASEWYEHLVPSESLVLPNCTLAYKDEPGNSTFEIKETVFNVGASKMFGQTTTRRLYLRTLSREETLKWIKALKAPK